MKVALSADEREALKEAAHHCLCQKARGAARALTRFYDRHFAGSGIEPTQFSLLVAIRLSEPVSLVQLAKYLGLERTTLTRNLRLLERDKLVRIESGKDARQRLISLTEKGRRSLRQTLALWQRAHHAAISVLGKDHFEQLSAALSLANKFTEN